MWRQGGRLPLAGHHTHTTIPLHRPARGRDGSLKRLTQQRGNGGGGLSWLHAGVQVCLQVKALSKRQAGRTCGTPRMGSPTVANTK